MNSFSLPDESRDQCDLLILSDLHLSGADARGVPDTKVEAGPPDSAAVGSVAPGRPELQDERVPAYRQALCASLLGHCGEAADAALLRRHLDRW